MEGNSSSIELRMTALWRSALDAPVQDGRQKIIELDAEFYGMRIAHVMNVFRSVRWFSSKPAAPSLSALEISQPGQVVPLKPSDLRSLLPEGFGGSSQFKIDPIKRSGKSKRDDQWWHCTHRPENFGLLIRPETTAILNNLKDLKSGKTASFSCVLDGEKGTGKSTILNHVALWARNNNWFVVQVPCAGALCSGNSRWRVNEAGELIQYEYMQQMMQSMISVHSQLLVKLAAPESAFGKKTQHPGTALGIAEHGVGSKRYAPECFSELMSSLLSQKDFPVLLSVDQVNAMSGPTKYVHNAPTPLRTLASGQTLSRSKSKPVDAGQLFLIQQLRRFAGNSNAAQVAFVGAATKTGHFAGHSAKPLCQELSVSNVVEIKGFSEEQTGSYVKFLVDNDVLGSSHLHEPSIRKAFVMTGGKPEELERYFAAMK
jgi:hypothetical protein